MAGHCTSTHVEATPLTLWDGEADVGRETYPKVRAASEKFADESTCEKTSNAEAAIEKGTMMSTEAVHMPRTACASGGWCLFKRRLTRSTRRPGKATTKSPESPPVALLHLVPWSHSRGR